jgi:hypothetical protein
MAIKRKDTPLAETPKPDYRNIQTKRSWFKDRPYVPTTKDSIQYQEGFERGLTGKNKWFPSKVSVKGYNEAKSRGLTPRRN